MARRFVLLPLLLVVLVNGDDCDPSCEGLAPGTLLPHPYDCSNYYICLPDESMTEFECPEGEQFDIVGGACTTGEVTCIECDPKGLCSYSCPVDNTEITFRADYYNCSNYYVCYNNQETQTSCDKDNPYYNGDICTDDLSQCCDPCVPYCPKENTMIPDLTDCKSFYLCTEVGVPDGGSLTCSTGNFDLNIGSCSEDATCYEPCAPTQTSGVTPPPMLGPAIDPKDCLSELICEKYGFFPICRNLCIPEFFHCVPGSAGHPAFIVNCFDGMLLDPDTMKCVEPKDCGYPTVSQLFQTLTISPT